MNYIRSDLMVLSVSYDNSVCMSSPTDSEYMDMSSESCNLCLYLYRKG